MFPVLSRFSFSRAPRALRARRKGEGSGTQCGTDWLARLSVVLRLSWKRCPGRNPAGVTSEVPKEKEEEAAISIYRDIERDPENREQRKEAGREKEKEGKKESDGAIPRTRDPGRSRGRRTEPRSPRFISRIWIHSAGQPTNQSGHPLMPGSLYASWPPARFRAEETPSPASIEARNQHDPFRVGLNH